MRHSPGRPISKNFLHAKATSSQAKSELVAFLFLSHVSYPMEANRQAMLAKRTSPAIYDAIIVDLQCYLKLHEVGC
jgi:hypothetical protein